LIDALLQWLIGLNRPDCVLPAGKKELQERTHAALKGCLSAHGLEDSSGRLKGKIRYFSPRFAAQPHRSLTVRQVSSMTRWGYQLYFGLRSGHISITVLRGEIKDAGYFNVGWDQSVDAHP